MSGGEFGRRGEHFSDDGVDIRFSGAMVHDAGSQGEVAVDGGVGQVDAAPTDDVVEDAAVEVVQINGSFSAR